jgi:hypothetical protein
VDAAWQLGDRLENIRHGRFFDYLAPGSGREQDARLTTLFRFAYYLGWREFVRIQVQLLRFENAKGTRRVAGFLNDVTWVLASDQVDGQWAMLWGDEQRGIGELMIEDQSGDSTIVRGHAFHRDYATVFDPWMERSLLAAVRAQKPSGPRLVAFFGVMYYAGLRPEEAIGLRKDNLHMPRISGIKKRGDGKTYPSPMAGASLNSRTHLPTPDANRPMTATTANGASLSTAQPVTAAQFPPTPN